MKLKKPLIVVTTDFIPNHTITEVCGLVRGNTIRVRHVGRDIVASLRHLVGGEIGEYTKLMAESREQALDRMTDEAEQLGADAIVSVRFTTSTVSAGAAELLAYGTAVKMQALTTSENSAKPQVS